MGAAAVMSSRNNNYSSSNNNNSDEGISRGFSCLDDETPPSLTATPSSLTTGAMQDIQAHRSFLGARSNNNTPRSLPTANNAAAIAPPPPPPPPPPPARASVRRQREGGNNDNSDAGFEDTRRPPAAAAPAAAAPAAAIAAAHSSSAALPAAFGHFGSGSTAQGSSGYGNSHFNLFPSAPSVDAALTSGGVTSTAAMLNQKLGLTADFGHLRT